MNIAERLQEAEQKFNDLNQTKQKLLQAYFVVAHKDIEDELLKLQGEYRALKALADEPDIIKPKKEK
jgi:hypothetical protein